MKNCIITIGCSGSGKSTWADEQVMRLRNVYKVERDEFRKLILRDKKNDLKFQWYKWNWKWEDEVTQKRDDFIKMLCEQHEDFTIIISDTNLDKNNTGKLVKKLLDLGFDSIEEKVFDLPFEELLKNDKKRGISVGFDVIARQYTKFYETYGQKYVPDKNLTKAVIFDLDGTLVKNGDRGIFDHSKLYLDTLDPFIWTLYQLLQSQDYKMILLTGRGGDCKKETIEWLRNNNVKYDSFFCRELKDIRPDYIFKKELFFNKIADFYDVHGVFEDRPQVVSMWNHIGLKCLAIGDQLQRFYKDFK